MAPEMSCEVCGDLSRRFLFKDKELGIPICSQKCEYKFLTNLSPSAAEHAKVVQYLDDKIRKYKMRNRIGWWISGVGAILLLLGFVIPEINAFISGGIMVSLSTLATRHFEDTTRKLTLKRKRLAI